VVSHIQGSHCEWVLRTGWWKEYLDVTGRQKLQVPEIYTVKSFTFRTIPQRESLQQSSLSNRNGVLKCLQMLCRKWPKVKWPKMLKKSKQNVDVCIGFILHKTCPVLVKKIKDLRTGVKLRQHVWLQLLVNSAACILLRRGQNMAQSPHHQHSLVWGYKGQDGVKYWCRKERSLWFQNIKISSLTN